MKGERLQKADFSHFPEIDIIEQALTFLMESLPSTVTRIHFHTLGLHAIAIREDDATSSLWPNEEKAVLMGSIVTSMKMCGVQNISYLKGSRDLFSLSSKLSQPVLKDHQNGIRFYISPVLVCKKPRFTVGAGDMISSTAIVHSMRSSAVLQE